jgi:hypothetical protein
VSRPASIQFDTGARTDRVTFALAPVDSVTGAIVTSGVSAKVAALMDRPIVNASGLLVFVNLPDQPQYEVEVDAAAAGYFSPVTLIVQPPARRVEIMLEPRPDYPFPAGTTLVRGVVVRGSEPVAGAAIEGRPQGSLGSFRARSSASGAFALALRLPPPDDFGAGRPVRTEIRFGGDGAARILNRDLVGGRSHSFLEPIDFDSTNEPEFFTT